MQGSIKERKKIDVKKADQGLFNQGETNILCADIANDKASEIKKLRSTLLPPNEYLGLV